MSVPIFRQQALDHFTSPEPLDQLMRVVRPQHWLALATCAALVGMAVLWSIYSQYTGQVLELTVHVGQVLQTGLRLGSIAVEDASSPLVAVSYFAIQAGKKFSPG